ncbi:hypothetical protein J6590_100868 [Homalodisca vitripennis]|nr:hypothetical protein J6590_100868 [Homalodisca vitripennis]
MDFHLPSHRSALFEKRPAYSTLTLPLLGGRVSEASQHPHTVAQLTSLNTPRQWHSILVCSGRVSEVSQHSQTVAQYTSLNQHSQTVAQYTSLKWQSILASQHSQTVAQYTSQSALPDSGTIDCLTAGDMCHSPDVQILI